MHSYIFKVKGVYSNPE